MCSIDNMLEQLKNSRQSMAKQIDVIDDILKNNSNNVLLQLETGRSKDKTPIHDMSTLKAYKCAKETEQSLARAIELYQHIPQNEENSKIQKDPGFADYIHNNCQNLHFLSSNVRKLLVVGDIMSKATEQTKQKEKENE